MKHLKDKNIINYFVTLISLLLVEIIFRLVSGTKVFNLSFLRVIIECNIISLILSFVMSLFSKKICQVLHAILIFLVGLYAYLQLGFINFLGVYMSVKTMGQVGAVKDYILDFLKSINISFYLVFIPFVLYIIVVILINKIRRKAKLITPCFYYLKHGKIINILSFAILLIVSVGCFDYSLNDNFMDDEYQIVTNKELFKNAENPTLCVKEFGIIPFSFIDLKSKINGNGKMQLDYLAYTNNNENLERTFDDTLWQEVINNETDETYNNLNNYFINNVITDKNEYTGLFEGKNLIVVMMESVNDIIINEEYYPNFYKIMQNSLYFENNYSPRNSCATGNNEFSAMTGLYSIYNTCTSNVYVNNTYYEAIFNLFNNKGYTTNSFHNYTNAYYYRTIIHPNMGSQTYYDVNSLGLDYDPGYGGWSSDEDLMNAYLEVLDTVDGNFASYITTVSSHQPYYSSKYGNLYYDMTSDTNYSEKVRHYMSKLKVLDNALGILIDGLTERNLLDDTVIVFFGDHYPYGLSIDNLSEVLSRDLTDYENEKVPLLIYNPSIEGKTLDTYTSYLNLTPTIANLFNLDYDPRLYMGMDIFSKEYNNTVVFADSSWKNSVAYYNTSSGTVKYYTDQRYTSEEIKNINNEIYTKTSASTLAIKYNYFAYLYEKLYASNEERKEN